MHSPTLSDEKLMQDVGRNRMTALAELVRRHQQRALQIAYRSLGDWQLAEDVVQEGFLRVHRAAQRYRPDAQFSTWFYRILVNLCMDQLRKRQRQGNLPSDVLARGRTSNENPEREQEIQELRQAVAQALSHLNERERMAVVLHRFESLSHEHIGEIMNTSVSAVESLLVRAYRKLRKELILFAETEGKKPQEAPQPDV